VHWYCLHTKPLKEAQVANYCGEHLGVETYFPRLRQQRVIRRQRKSVVAPLFPRYLFCRFDAAVFFRAVRYAPEVLSVVSAGNAPAIVADSLIEELKQWASATGGVITLRPTLQIGDQVEVISGPMQGLSGIILGDCSERARVTVLLSILQCGAQLNVERSEVRRIA
jgi:transcriptional antiterminator RfaH